MVGASGAISGVVVVYTVLYPRRQIYFYGILPVEMRWFAEGRVKDTPEMNPLPGQYPDQLGRGRGAQPHLHPELVHLAGQPARDAQHLLAARLERRSPTVGTVTTETETAGFQAALGMAGSMSRLTASSEMWRIVWVLGRR